jgi:hypothetical protein
MVSIVEVLLANQRLSPQFVTINPLTTPSGSVFIAQIGRR